MKSAIIAVCLMFSFFILPAGQAATMNDLVGVWQVSSSETLTVKGLGADPGVSSGTCTFAPGGTYSASFGSGSSAWHYSGDASLDSKGKKLNWNLSGGTEELKDLLKEWIIDWAYADGYDVDADSVSVDLQSVTCKVIKIDKNTNRPGTALLKVKGTVSGIVDGEYVTRKISYTSQISFISGPTP